MPKNTKGTKTTKTRTQAKGLSRTEHELTVEESKKIKGGLDPTSVRLPSPARAEGNPQPQKV
jgi:hypothetical protein